MKYFLILLLFTGCGYDATCRVESNTRWLAEINGNRIDSVGNATFNLSNWKDCVTIQKQTSVGFISMEIDLENTWFGKEDGGSRRTETPFGTIQICD